MTYPSILFAIFGFSLIAIVLWDSFETIIFPRRVTRRTRPARLFYQYTWSFWSTLVRWIFRGKYRENLLSLYGPVSLLLLVSLWACALIVGFGLLFWACGAAVMTAQGNIGFTTCLYFSGTTFFTLGLGDVTPVTSWARFLTVLEAGVGFGFLAIVIGYLPGFNQSFSRREASITLLDARAGSPPTAAEMLRRHNLGAYGMEAIRQLLYQWELWTAELLESHLSYPVLAYFRSQHDNQSWLAALTTILDTSALVLVGLEGACEHQAQLTFAMARHAVVDLCLIFDAPPCGPESDRLPLEKLARLRNLMAGDGLVLREGREADDRLAELRQLYEPYVCALSNHFRLALPPWVRDGDPGDNWQTSAWGRRAWFGRRHSSRGVGSDHF